MMQNIDDLELIEVDKGVFKTLDYICERECRSHSDQIKYMMRKLRYPPPRKVRRKSSDTTWPPERRAAQAERMKELNATLRVGSRSAP